MRLVGGDLGLLVGDPGRLSLLDSDRFSPVKLLLCVSGDTDAMCCSAFRLLRRRNSDVRRFLSELVRSRLVFFPVLRRAIFPGVRFLPPVLMVVWSKGQERRLSLLPPARMSCTTWVWRSPWTDSLFTCVIRSLGRIPASYAGPDSSTA